MARRVLIADDVATNRIILKVKLASARYDVVQAADVAETVARVHETRPDLVMVSQSLPGGGPEALCAALKSEAELANIPVVAVLAHEDRRARLSALQAGVCDVLVKPLEELPLLALVRNLIRKGLTRSELSRRQDAARDFGFAEAPTGFTRPAQIALIAANAETGLAWRAALAPHIRAGIEVVTRDAALELSQPGPAPDAYVVAADLARPGEGLHLISELRSREAARHAVALIYQPSSRPEHLAMALDLGANGVVAGVFDGEEVAARLSRQIALKRDADAMRESLDAQLDLALRDPLTGLYNRRYAHSYLARMTAAAAENGEPLTLMVLDLDRFKSVNDRFGHAVGDEVLVEVATRLKANLREIDLVARIGGEEFLVAMPQTNRDDASRAAERLRRAVGERPVRSAARGVNVPVTMSIGVVVTPTQLNGEQAIDEMIDRADHALYNSKAEGRNQITFVRPAA